MDKPELKLWWEAREPAQADDARRLSRFVTGLPDFDPIYQSWLKSPKTRKETVPVPLSEAEAKQLLIDNMARYDSPPALGRRREATSGEATRGLRLMIFASRATPTPFAISAHSAGAPPSIRIHPHAAVRRASVHGPPVARVRAETADEIRARGLAAGGNVRDILFLFEPQKIPDPTWAGGERTLEPRIGWITYLPPDLAARAKYPADVEVETLADGAALVTLCEEPFGKGDAAGLARLHALEAALRPIQS